MMRFEINKTKANSLTSLFMNLGFAVVILASSFLVGFQSSDQPRFYNLSDQHKALLNNVGSEFRSKYSYNNQLGYFSYNNEIIAEDSTEPINNFLSQYGAGTDEASNIYGARIFEDTAAVRAYSANMKLGIGLAPQFEVHRGGIDQGHFVFPLKGQNGALVYTPMINGLKEDIVLNQAPNDETVSYSYELSLSDYLEARIEDDGSVGVYSAALEYFDETTFSTDKDLDLIMQRRAQAPKTNLVFGIPAPVIVQSGDEPNLHDAKSWFELDGQKLTVYATGLSGLEYPVSIDPSLSVTTDADFGANSSGGFIEYGGGSITRGGLTGGSLKSRATDDSLPATRSEGGLVIHDGYAYYVGGSNGSNYYNTVYRSTVGAGGDLTSWATLTGDDLLDTATRGHALVDYNGYMYAIGGENSGSTGANVVQYVDFGASGALGNWNTTSTLPSGRDEIAAAAYNGYMYAIGGRVGGTYHDDVYSAPINANGTLGTWSSQGVIPGNRAGHDVFISNGVIYVVGGTDGTVRDTVYYAYLDRTGGISGSWQTAGSLDDAMTGISVATYNGYAYIVGGGNSSTVGQNWTQYGSISGGGGVSGWDGTDTLSVARRENSTYAYNGYVYTVGGINSGGSHINTVERFTIDDPGELSEFVVSATLPTSGSGMGVTVYDDHVYIIGNNLTNAYSASINQDGSLGSFTTESSTSYARLYGCAVGLNGYIYAIGGYNNTSTFIDAVEFKAIEADGTLTAGSWSTTTVLPERLFNPSCFAYNGRLYVFSGRENGFGPNNRDLYYATPNADGTVSSWSSPAGIYEVPGYVVGQNNRSAIYNGRVYTQAQNLSDVYYADILPDSFGSWTQTTASDPAWRVQAGLAIWNGFLYLSTGYNNGSTYYSSVVYGKIEDDGDITSFITTSSIPSPAVRAATSVAVNGKLHIFGGYTGSTAVDTVKSATIGVGGFVDGSDGVGGSNLSTAVTGHCTLAMNGHLYRIGGDTGGGNELSSVEYSSIDASGSNGSWAATGSMPAARAYGSCATHDGWIYYTGGVDSSASRTTTVYATKPKPDGSITSWTQMSSFTTARKEHQAVVLHDYLYVLGGDTSGGATATVYKASIGADGVLGSFSSTTSMMTARENFAAVGALDYIYVLGGQASGSRIVTEEPTAQTSAQVEYAIPSAVDGTIPGSGTGYWASTTSTIYPIEGHRSFAYGGYLYLVGGLYTNSSGSAAVDDRIQVAPISANGKLGTWYTTANLDIARHQTEIAEYDGRVHVVAGYSDTGTTDTTDVEYFNLGPISRKTTYTKVIDISDDLITTSLSYSGSVSSGSKVNLHVMPGCSSGGNFSGDILRQDNLKSTTDVKTRLIGRYLHLLIEIDDSGSAIFADEYGTASSVDQLDVEYQYGWVTPDLRLRGGNFFYDQEEQPYDTSEELAGGALTCY